MKALVRGTHLLILGVMLLALPSVASAQYYYARPRPHYYGAPGVSPIDRPGMYLGISGMGDFVVNQANSSVGDFIGQGGGFGLMLGVRLNPVFALEFGYQETLHNPVEDVYGNTIDWLGLHGVTADIKLIFPNPSNVRPYIQGGVGFYGLAYAFSDWVASGGGFQLGGGLDIWLNPWWSLGARLLYHGIYLNDITYADGSSESPFLSTVSIEGNLQIHF
jgi:hypothetical protein